MSIRVIFAGVLIFAVFLSSCSSSGDDLSKQNGNVVDLFETITGEALSEHGATGRKLFQALTSCPMSFEYQNYTIITSKCRGPNFTAPLCCSALKEFACPFAYYINNETTDCASTMFSYINLRGRYPPGLFASLCKDDQYGLICEAPAPSVDNTTSSGAWPNRKFFGLDYLAIAGSLWIMLVDYWC